MIRLRLRLTMGVLLGSACAVWLSGCNFPMPQGSLDVLPTSAELTVESRLTEAAAATPTLEMPTSTPPPTSAGSVFTDTPTPSPTPECEDKAFFVMDVTIPDGTFMKPGQEMEKTWRLRNDGTCLWTLEYALVFDSGDILGADPVTPLFGPVQPGNLVDLSVMLTAPTTNGPYVGNWKLRNAEGIIFGLGSNADKPFWVAINVGPTPTPEPSPVEVAYDFSDHYCDAVWASGAGALACPGSDTDLEGYVIRLSEPELEAGVIASEPGLWTQPQLVADGYISGRFPAVQVQSGDRFLATLGCKEGATLCDVRYQLNYHADGGPIGNLGEWHEDTDGMRTKINIDLSSLAGKSVEFVLTVLANGPFNDDSAIWVYPRIMR